VTARNIAIVIVGVLLIAVKPAHLAEGATVSPSAEGAATERAHLRHVISAASVSPDGHYLALAERPLGIENLRSSRGWLVDLVGVSVRQLPTYPYLSGFAWRPDSGALAYATHSSGLDIVSLSSNAHERLGRDSTAPLYCAVFAWPKWSPDGLALAFEGGACDLGEDGGYSRQVLLEWNPSRDALSQEPRIVAKDMVGHKSFCWIPSSGELLYLAEGPSSTCLPPGTRRLPQPWTGTTVHMVSCRTGQSVAATVLERGRGQYLALFDPATGIVEFESPLQVTSNPPLWSPDGKKLLFALQMARPYADVPCILDVDSRTLSFFASDGLRGAMPIAWGTDHNGVQRLFFIDEKQESVVMSDLTGRTVSSVVTLSPDAVPAVSAQIGGCPRAQ
jgi:hypothetical protein